MLRDRAALKIQGSADHHSPTAKNSLLCMCHCLFIHTDVFRNNSADVDSYTFVCCVFFFLRQVRGGIKPSFLLLSTKSILSMATPVSMVHAVLPFREALLRDTYNTHTLSCDVVAFYSTLKKN